ncbi:MAG: Holliday junction branch migration protein RuvA [Candidatus Cloacimonadaceae bacterium]
MVFYISGTLKEKAPTGVIVDVNGVGVELRIPLSTYEKLPSVGKNCTLFTHLYLSLNQDEIRLYGFSSLAEKTLFLRLISISGIGPKIALSIISSMSINMVIKAILTEEDGLLAQVPGIGKKTAQRIIIELRDKIAELTESLDTTERTKGEHSFAEVEKALIALGYNGKDVLKTLHKLSDEDKQLPVEQQIKKVIRLLYQR